MAPLGDENSQAWQGSTSNGARAQGSTTGALPGAAPQRRHGNDESWIEVSSHPSSSSVSSIGDEIVTTGLRVGSSYATRRRRLHPHYAQPNPHAHQQSTITSSAGHAGTSSQEEYDESESEEDQVLTSSTENLDPTTGAARRATSAPLQQGNLGTTSTSALHSEDEDSDIDDNTTALGRRPSEPFQPQPNAFTQPTPSHLTHRHSASSAIPEHHPRPSFSQRSHTRVDRRTPNFMSPSYQADHDAALRASLTTLLSCAAAARSRPKDDDKNMLADRAGPSTATGSQPVELRLVPESELLAAPSPAPPTSSATSGLSRRASSSPSHTSTAEKAKRSATPTPPGGKSPRATKKKKTTSAAAEETFISPTLLTWVVSAGFVVLVSVVGFGAGYVIGREVGRQENLGSLGGSGNATALADGGNCGSEIVRSSGGTLRRFRWGAGMGRSVVA